MIPPTPPTDPDRDPLPSDGDEPVPEDGDGIVTPDGDRGRSGNDGIPDFRTARRHILIELVRLAAVLREDGVKVPPSATLSAAQALSVVGLSERDAVEAALRASLLSSADDADAFAEAFPSFWHRLRSGLSAVATDHDGPEAGDDGAADVDGAHPDADTDDSRENGPDTLEGAAPPDLDGDGDGDVEVRIPTGRRHATGERATEPDDGDRRRASAVEGGELIDVDSAPTVPGEQAAVQRFVDALATLPGRRRRPSSTGPRVDARRALRDSLATGGAPVTLPATTATESELRCCLLLDVSGSVLDTVDRTTLLSVAEGLSDAARDSRVFLFDTELADATDAFARADGDAAAALRAAEVKWGGGTEIGEALATLRREHPHAVDRRTVVVVVSDGLDVGEVDLLDAGITWLADRASAVVWLNPLAVSPAFEPRSRGMAACEPYVDALFGFAGPDDLAAAARQLERRGLDGAVGYRYDPRRHAEPDGGTETGSGADASDGDAKADIANGGDPT